MQPKAIYLSLVIVLAFANLGLAADLELSTRAQQTEGGYSARPRESQSEPLTLQATLGNSVYSRTTPKRLVLKVDLVAKSTKPIHRKPLNLALVFDRSGSMAKQKKFEYAIQAAKLIIENLSPDDVISLIIFGDEAVTLSPAGYAVNKEFLYHCLADFKPEGNTNLSAGMLESFAQIDSMSQEGQHKQVIVLTDGLANRGVSNPAKITGMIEQARKRGIHLSTIGCGSKFDEKLMADMATAGSGRYTLVKEPEGIPKAVANELNGLLAVVAQNVKLDVRPSRGNPITRVYGDLIPEPRMRHGAGIGDMRDGESKIMLLEIKPGARGRNGSLQVLVTVTYDDPESGSRKTQQVNVTARYDSAYSAVQASESRSVLLYANVLNAMEEAQAAIESLDTKLFNSLRKSFEQIYEETRAHAIVTSDQLLLNQTFLLNHFMAELWAASQNAPLHDHAEARRQLQKDVEYQRYLLGHHRKPKAGSKEHEEHKER